MTDLVNQMALYLESAGIGTTGSDLIVDAVPDTPSELIVLTHHGGSAEFKFDPPDSWCKMSVLVRSPTASGALQRMQQAIQKLVDPGAGVIEVEGTAYTAEVTALPMMLDRDSAGRYAVKSVCMIRQVALSQEPWLAALSELTRSILGEPWHVYQGFAGTCRPSVSWQCVKQQSASSGSAMNRLTKTYEGRVAARTAQEYDQAAQAILCALSERSRLCLGIENSRWLTISDSSAELKPGSLNTGVCTVSMTGSVESAPVSPAPLIAGVFTQPNSNV